MEVANLNKIIVNIMVFAIGILIGLVPLTRGTDYIGLFVLFLGVCSFIVFLFYCCGDSNIRLILTIALVLRLGLALCQAYILPLPGSTADAVTFERMGWETAQFWLGSSEVPVKLTGAYIYSGLIGVFYYIFGRVAFIPQLVNVFLGVGIVFVVYKLTLAISDSKGISQVAAFAIALFPTLNLYSAILLRENTIVFFTAISIYCFVLWLRGGAVLNILLALLCLVTASALHGAIILIGLVYSLFLLFYNPHNKQWSVSGPKLLIGMIILIILFGIFGDVLRNKLPSDMTLLFSPEYLAARTASAARNRAAYLEGLVPTSITSLIIYTPLRAFYFFFSPLPWMISNSADLVGFLDAFLYGVFFLYAAVGLLQIRKKDKNTSVALLLIMIIFTVAFAWGTSNYGTAIRHRQKIVWLMISLASIGISGSKMFQLFFRRLVKR